MSNDYPAKMKLSIIIPVLNEAEGIGACLGSLQELRRRGHEVIVVDGGSADATPAVAAPGCDKLINSARGRARQMNAGAAVATGDIVVFLHADTLIPFDLEKALNRIEGDNAWGCFSVRLSGAHPLLRLIGFFINLRSRWTGIISGDQTLFVLGTLFNHAGGYPDIPLMEDIAFSKTLKRYRAPVCLGDTVISSSRRWERYGIVKTMLRMWLRRFRFAVGVNPAILAKDYE